MKKRDINSGSCVLQSSTKSTIRNEMKLFHTLFLAALALGAAAKIGDIIEDSYIVVLKPGITDSEFSSHYSWAADLHSEAVVRRGAAAAAKGIKHTYNIGKGLKGYAGSFNKETIQEIASRAEVAYVEPDRVVEVGGIVVRIGDRAVKAFADGSRPRPGPHGGWRGFRVWPLEAPRTRMIRFRARESLRTSLIRHDILPQPPLPYCADICG